MRHSIVLGILLAANAPAGAQQPASVPLDRPMLTLDQLIAKGLAVSPEVQAANAGVANARAKKSQASGTRFPQLELTTIVGPSPEAKGSILSSPNTKGDPEITNVFVRNEMSIVQPIYTFGRISGLNKAASEGIEISNVVVWKNALTAEPIPVSHM